MDYGAVEVGDIIFADWDHDGTINHTMIVTDYCHTWEYCYYSNEDPYPYRGYNRIRLTYQSYNRTNIGLGDLNEDYNYQALFYVYRPIDYNPSGL
jgi:hypothetical protein